MEPQKLWQRYRKHLCNCPGLGISLDISRMPFEPKFLRDMEPAMQAAYEAMAKLEAGAVANADEKRMVGHYWLRDATLAPEAALTKEIEETVERVATFAKAVHRKEVTPPLTQRFTDLLLVGIGGSALGPQLVSDALGAKRDKMRVHFLDNTDPDGIYRTLESLRTRLKSSLVVVISKSGGTPETRNGMLETKAAFAAQGLDFAKHAVAVTSDGSKLDQMARSEGWLERFPMWDWVGGRTSITSAVGLLPMALQGLDIKNFLAGAAKMDALTRQTNTKRNPAALLALMWHLATNGQGEKDMVILPYKDRLCLLSKYLQQLVMESLGKELDREGNTVEQGIAVYGNKGSTDQHAYVQQLRDGLDNFFVTFLVVLLDSPMLRRDKPIDVEGIATTGDFLNGFWQGTRQALADKGRGSMTITVQKLDAKTLGALIGLYERAVGLYAELVNINAYHQPGVEAGKKAAATVLDLQTRMVEHLKANPDAQLTPEELADALGDADAVETLFHLAEHLAANKRHVTRVRKSYQYLAPTA